jgi:hypothetical protein
MMNVRAAVIVGVAIGATIVASGRVSAQIADSPDDAVADIPVNYTEAKVGLYTLPDPFASS